MKDDCEGKEKKEVFTSADIRNLVAVRQEKRFLCMAWRQGDCGLRLLSGLSSKTGLVRRRHSHSRSSSFLFANRKKKQYDYCHCLSAVETRGRYRKKAWRDELLEKWSRDTLGAGCRTVIQQYQGPKQKGLSITASRKKPTLQKQAHMARDPRETVSTWPSAAVEPWICLFLV